MLPNRKKLPENFLSKHFHFDPEIIKNAKTCAFLLCVYMLCLRNYSYFTNYTEMLVGWLMCKSWHSFILCFVSSHVGNEWEWLAKRLRFRHFMRLDRPICFKRVWQKRVRLSTRFIFLSLYTPPSQMWCSHSSRPFSGYNFIVARIFVRISQS